MTDSKDPSKDALSRALGAAFLSHKVEELEKTVSTSPKTGGMYYKEKRERRLSPTMDGGPRGRGSGQRRGNQTRPQRGGRARGGTDADEYRVEQERGSDAEDRWNSAKDADIVVVDASLLIHALGKLKVWSRNNREETVIVPLEALNTLDLLKKGTTPLAQRARAASRILEQQVGTNPRIKVQRDDAFVLWGDIPFEMSDPASDSATSDALGTQHTPEWLRRTICCARWELEQASKATEAGKGPSDSIKKDIAKPFKVIIAVCTSPGEFSLASESSGVPSPVPLPAPHPPSKFEQRCAGTLVAHWANSAGLEVLDVKPFPASHSPNGTNSNVVGNKPRSGTSRHIRNSSDEDWRGPNPSNATVRKPQSFQIARAKPPSREGAGDKTASENIVYGPGLIGGTLVERPAATVAMSATMLEPKKVIRVLARGEKLEP